MTLCTILPGLSNTWFIQHLVYPTPGLSNTWFIQHLVYPTPDLSNTWFIQHLVYPTPDLSNTWFIQHLGYPTPGLSNTWVIQYLGYLILYEEQMSSYEPDPTASSVPTVRPVCLYNALVSRVCTAQIVASQSRLDGFGFNLPLIWF